MAAALERIDRIALLKKGWDSYDAEPIPSDVIDAAKGFVAWFREAYPSLPEPQPVPTTYGGVVLHWLDGHDDTSLTFERDGGAPLEARLYVYREGKTELHKTINPNCPICREQVVAAVEGRHASTT